MRHILLASCAIIIAGTALPVLAQSAPADDSAPDAIIVTAQKRSENLQNVPLAISVLGGEAIANSGALNLENAQYLVPSLNFRKSGTSLNQALFLRGVGTINFSIAAEPSVAAVLDGVVLSRAGEGFVDLYDVERIEVLRGPQGTLFGKNASAGVVSIVTKRPTDEFEGTAEASYFDKQEYRGRLTLNTPLGEGLSARVTGFYSQYDGNIRNIALNRDINGYKHYGVRGAIEGDFGDTINVILRADWRKAKDDCCAEIIGTTPTNAASLALSGTNISGDQTRSISQNLVTATNETSWGASLEANIDIAEHTLTSISSYRKWDNEEIRDGDWLDRVYVGLNQLHDFGPQTSNTFSQELRIASPAGQFLEYVAGVYYSRAKSDRTFTRNVITCSASTLAPVAPGLTPCATGSSTQTFPSGTADFGSIFRNLSVFGQATLNISDDLRLIGGLRYTDDKLSVNHIRRTTLAGPGIAGNFDAGVYNNGALNANGIGFLAGPSNGIPFTAVKKNDNFSGKGAVQFDFTDDVMAYASYTRGYKGPAYNIFFNLATVGAGVIEPETVDALEAGLKNSFMDGKVIINLATYYAKYKNYQANNPDIVAGQVVSRLTNAGTVSTRGFEADFILRPVDALNITGGLAYTNARVNAFRLPPGGNPANLIPSGTPLANAPKWKLALGSDYTHDTGSGVNIVIGAQMAMQSKQLYQLDPSAAVRAATTVKGYSTVDLSTAIVDADDRWKVALQVKNLFDATFASSIVTGGPGGSLRYIIPREADRTFGITATYNFGK
jgi:iron complex outermembrane recepter protein